MTILSASEQTLVNQVNHSTDLYLSIYKPNTALACQVNGAYDADNQTISYDNVTEGSYLNIVDYDFLVALIGSTPGNDDIGRTWVRSATSSQIRFVESDHINWTDDLYVTVLDFIEIIPVFPRIIQNPANELDVIFYKFYDVAYTDQNSILGTFVNMGCHYAGFVDPASGQASVYYTSSGTSNLLSEAMTYNWSFEGALTTGSTSSVPGWVNYDTPGYYKTVLEVTSDSGRVDRSTRYISIYDAPGTGDINPILEWQFTDLSGSRDAGGSKISVKIDSIVTEEEIIDGALVVIFAQEYYGATKQSIGGNAANRQTIKFVGWIVDGSIRTNYKNKTTEFDILSPAGIMQLAECFSVSLESKISPSTWFELLNMDIRRAIYHYLAWHSTVMKLCDMEYVGDDRNIQFFDNDRESLYDAINSLMEGARVGKIVSDRQGKLWMETEASSLDNVSTTFDTALTVTHDDWIEEPIIDEKQTSETSFIEMGGIYYDPVTNTFSAHLASAPGVAPRYRGRVERIQGLALSGQTELNSIIGNLLAWNNARYPSLDMQLRTNFSNLDIAPQEIVKVTMTTDDNSRGISFSEKSFMIRGVTWTYDAEKKAFLPRVDLHEATQGFAGTTIIIPDVPPTEGEDGGSFTVPPFTVPPIPQAVPIITGTSVGINQYLFLYDNPLFEGYQVGTSPTYIDLSYHNYKLERGADWLTQLDTEKIKIPGQGIYKYELAISMRILSGPLTADMSIFLHFFDGTDSLITTGFGTGRIQSIIDNGSITVQNTGMFPSSIEGNVVSYVKVYLSYTPSLSANVSLNYFKSLIYKFSGNPPFDFD